MEKLNRNVQREYSAVEIYGAEIVFNKCYETTFGENPKEEFFLSNELLNSTYDANGTPLYIDDEIYISHLLLQHNGMVITVGIDREENYHYYRTEENNAFYELEDYKVTYNLA